MLVIVEIIAGIFAVAAIFALLGATLYLIAKNGWQATFIPEGNMALLVKGDSWDRTIPNIAERTLDKKGRKIIKGKPQKKPWEKIWGFYWVSFFYPLKRVFKFTISRDRLKDASEMKDGHGIRDWIEHKSDQEVSSLQYRFQRPFLIEGVELGGDRTRVDQIVMTTFEVVDPYIPIFFYKGKFFSLLEATVRSAVLDFCADEHMTYEVFVRTPKSSGTEFSDRITDINEKTDLAPEGIVKAFGIKVVEAWVHDFDLVKDDQDFRDAARIRELERMQAQGAVEKAKGEAEAKERVAKAEALRYGLLVKELIERDVDPNVAASVLGQQVRTENIGRSKIVTYVEGGASIMPTIPVTGDKSKGEE